MNLLSSQYIVDIINKKMAMPPDRVILRDQNFKWPDDTAMRIIVGIVNSFPMAAESYMIPSTPTNWDQTDPIDQVFDQPSQNFDQTATQIEVNEVQMQEWVQIDVASRNNDAIMRNWEVIAALNSFYSQQVQELNNFKIFRLPRGPSNTSSAEGGSFLNRYTLTVPCFVWYRKETTMVNSPYGDYYSDFNTRVDDSHTIGSENPLISFEIDQEGIVP